MQFMGSKNRIARHILPTMLAAREDRPWIEPFVGGANMLDKIDGERVGNDNHAPLVALLCAVRDGWIPPVEVSRETYYDVKLRPSSYAEHLVGFVGFLCSFGGKWWGGYAANNKGDNYAARGSRMMTKQGISLRGATITSQCYTTLSFSRPSLIYCDPPYAGTTSYRDKFDHERFWRWCNDRHDDGHVVFVSEYTAPDDWECAVEVPYKTILDKNSQYPRTERLFRRRA